MDQSEKKQNEKEGAFGQAPINPKVRLLREVAELVMWELRAIEQGKWEDLPTLRTKKGQLMNRMLEFDWKPALVPDQENPELLLLQAQIVDMEYRIRQRVKVQSETLHCLMDDLQRRTLRFKNTLNPYYKGG